MVLNQTRKYDQSIHNPLIMFDTQQNIRYNIFFNLSRRILIN